MTEHRQTRNPSRKSNELGRRRFLQMALASPFVASSVAARPTSDAIADPQLRRQADPSPVASTQTSKSLQELFPLNSELVSLRGLGPDNSRQVSLRDLIQSRGSPAHTANLTESESTHSLREIITPQRYPESRVGSHLLAYWGTGWENWLEDYTRDQAKSLAGIPSGADSPSAHLVARVVELVKTNSPFRGVGSGHSHSEAAVPKEFFSDLKELSGELDTTKWLWDEENPYWRSDDVERDTLLRLEAGTVLKKLNRDILPKKKLALPNMGAWDGQTLAGAINTSTHGTGLNLGTFADLVKSVEIVVVTESRYIQGAPYIRMLRIEPSNGITDPEKFAADAHTHGMSLVQNDDIFNSVVVGYGCMGVAYAYTLQLEKAYWLREENVFKQWGQFNVQQEAEDNRHYTIYVDLTGPQLDGASRPICLVRARKYTPSHGRKPTERVNPLNATEGMTKAFGLHMEEKDLEEFGQQLDQLQSYLQAFYRGDIKQLLGYDPPFDKKRHETASYIALRRKKDKEPKKTDEPPEPPSDAITTEIAVPVEKVEQAVDRVIQFVKDQPRFFPAPLGVRFTGPSHQYFSPEYGRKTAMLEFAIPMPEVLAEQFASVKTIHDNKLLGSVEANPVKLFYQKLKKINQDSRQSPHDGKTGILDHFLNIDVAKDELEKIEDILVREFDGRPHLGKHNTVHANSARDYMRPVNMFPKYKEWVEVNRHLNQRRTFDNLFSDHKVDRSV